MADIITQAQPDSFAVDVLRDRRVKSSFETIEYYTVMDARVRNKDSKPYNSIKAFSDLYSIEYDKKEKSLKNFKLFIIMDTDDCTEDFKDDYISGKLFENCCLKDYIVPIYNSPNLEEVKYSKMK